MLATGFGYSETAPSLVHARAAARDSLLSRRRAESWRDAYRRDAGAVLHTLRTARADVVAAVAAAIGGAGGVDERLGLLTWLAGRDDPDDVLVALSAAQTAADQLVVLAGAHPDAVVAQLAAGAGVLCGVLDDLHCAADDVVRALVARFMSATRSSTCAADVSARLAAVLLAGTASGAVLSTLREQHLA